MWIKNNVVPKKDADNLKRQMRQIKLWHNHTNAEEGIAQAIRTNPGMLTEKLPGIFSNTLVAEYFINKGNENINKAIIDAAPEILNKYYSDFGQEYEQEDFGGLSQKKHNIGYLIAIKNTQLITYMLEKNAELAEDNNFIKFAIEFGSEGTIKYIIENFTSKIFEIDTQSNRLFANQIIDITESMNIVSSIENKLKIFMDRLPADSDIGQQFNRLEKQISKFKREYLKRFEKNEMNKKPEL